MQPFLGRRDCFTVDILVFRPSYSFALSSALSSEPAAGAALYTDYIGLGCPWSADLYLVSSCGIFVTVSICCQEELHWQRAVSDPWVQREDLDYSKESRWSSKVAVGDYFLISLTSLVSGTWPGFQHQAWFPFCWEGFKSKHTAFDDHWHVNGTYCIFMHVLLSRSLIWFISIAVEWQCNDFHTLTACIVVSGTVEARSQERGFQVRSNSNDLSPLS